VGAFLIASVHLRIFPLLEQTRFCPPIFAVDPITWHRFPSEVDPPPANEEGVETGAIAAKITMQIRLFFIRQLSYKWGGK